MKRFIIAALFAMTCHFGYAQITDSTATPADTSHKVQTPAPVPAPAPAAPAAAPDPAAAPKESSGNKRTFREKFAVGFGTGFWITPSTTYVELAPSIAYRFPKILITGIGYRYIYRHDRVRNNDLHSYGPNVFARANLTKRIYFWTEYELLHSQYFDEEYTSDNYTRESDDIDSWFVGLGYVRSIGKRGRGGLGFQVLYNVLYENNDYSPYYSAWSYRVGYFF
jgi:hypothetical protein